MEGVLGGRCSSHSSEISEELEGEEGAEGEVMGQGYTFVIWLKTLARTRWAFECRLLDQHKVHCFTCQSVMLSPVGFGSKSSWASSS